MSVQRLILRAKVREFPQQVVSPQDFVFDPGPELDPEWVFGNPNLSLYCFDPNEQRALMVETPEGAHLGDAPFYYVAQYEHCSGLVAVPYAALLEMAETVALDERRLILVHSTGRCGSTLISKALAAVPGMSSFSEPDVFTQLTWMYHDAAFDRDLVRRLLAASIRWVCREHVRETSSAFWAVKFRSQVMELLSELHGLFPQARHVFLYRNGLTWLESIFRAVMRDASLDDVERNRRSETSLARFHPLVVAQRRPEQPMSPACLWTLGWVSSMERYLEAHAAGMAPFTLRYEDLKADPRHYVRALFEYCDLEVDDMTAVDAALARDSQEGSHLSRSEIEKAGYVVPSHVLDEAARIIASRQLLTGPDMTLPGTVRRA